MGTSSSGAGAGGNNPLIPSWIGGGDGPGGPPDGNPPDTNPDTDNQQGDGSPENGTGNGIDNDNSNEQGNNQNSTDSATGAIPLGVKNRYTPGRRSFNDYVKSNGTNSSHARNALRSYVTKGGGGSSVLSKRMTPSVSRVGVFISTLNDIRASGKSQVLTSINLGAYINKPLNETLSALSDEIFKDTGKIYEETQDDSITKQAYSNTVVRICQIEGIDLDNLSNDNIEVMTAIFIEETISQRVICDIGNNMTKLSTDVDMLIEIENNVYQIVCGLVRNQIMPEIIATQLGNKADLDKNIQNIYRIAFDAIVDLTD